MEFNETKRNKKEREGFRKIIAEALKNRDFDSKDRRRLSDEDLEDLLFESVNSGEYKRLAYLYEGLCKLDLSGVSFENVSFDSDVMIDLSNTNANIDFTKVHTEGFTIARNINFNNVNLEFSFDDKIPGSSRFVNCVLTNTGDYAKSLQIEYHDCNLSGIDLSEAKGFYEIDQDGNNCLALVNNEKYTAIRNCHPRFYNCNLTNTKLRVYTQNEYRADDQDWIAASKYIAALISKGYLDHCYVNGKLIKTIEERKQDAEELLRQHKLDISRRNDRALKQIEDSSDLKGGRQVGPKDASKTSSVVKNQKENEKFEASVASFYGCDDAPALPVKGVKKPKTKKLEKPSGDLGSFYGCDN